jgi:hypothetical protein
MRVSKVLISGTICQGASLQSKGVSGMRREDDSSTIYALGRLLVELLRSLAAQAGSPGGLNEHYDFSNLCHILIYTPGMHCRAILNSGKFWAWRRQTVRTTASHG